MENLPAEWADKIDRIEVMTEMDGRTQRTVAIQKSGDPDAEPRLRALQWDADAGEWVGYAPKVGWAGWGEVVVDGKVVSPSRWNENIQLPDMGVLAEPLRLADGTELQIGYLGEIYSTVDKSDNASRKSYFQGYILDIVSIDQSCIVYNGILLNSGDWQVFVSVYWEDSGEFTRDSMTLENLSLYNFGKYRFENGMPLPLPSMTTSQICSYFSHNRNELIGQPIIQGIMLDPSRNIGLDTYESRKEFVDNLRGGDQPMDTESILESNPSLILPNYVCERIAAEE